LIGQTISRHKVTTKTGEGGMESSTTPLKISPVEDHLREWHPEYAADSSARQAVIAGYP